MNINELLISTCISIFVPIISSTLTIIVKRWVDTKIKDIENKRIRMLISEGTDIILNSVNYVQQIYVDTLKQNNSFNEEARREAFYMARARALELLPEEIYKAIDERYGNINVFVETLIESELSELKKSKQEKKEF